MGRIKRPDMDKGVKNGIRIAVYIRLSKADDGEEQQHFHAAYSDTEISLPSFCWLPGYGI